MVIALLIAAVVGYLIGAIPFGVIVAHAHGVDIFEVGSKSTGATNVRRVLGARAGNLVFSLDALKGAVAAGWALLARGGKATTFDLAVYGHLDGLMVDGGMWLLMGVVGLVAALVGHSFSVFIGFRGGKGVATTTGGFLVLMPWVIIVAFLIWLVVFYSSRYVSLASIIAAISLPIAAFFFHQPPGLQALALIVALLIVLLHRKNVRRLLDGTENRFVKKTNSSSPDANPTK